MADTDAQNKLAELIEKLPPDVQKVVLSAGAGAAVGSVVPGVGTAIGVAAGTAAGLFYTIRKKMKE